MSKRLTAALCALLVAASTLAVVASPAAAHDIYHWAHQKQQKCAYDPFAGRQCWTETVRVKVPSHHSHAQVCPEGTTGTYPNCYPVPPTTTDPTPDKDWTDPKDGGDGSGGDGTGGDGSGGDGTGGDGSGGDGTGGDGSGGDGSGGDGTGGDGSGGDGSGGDGTGGDGTGGDDPQHPGGSDNEEVDKPDPPTTCLLPNRAQGHKHGSHGCHRDTPNHTHGSDDDDDDDSTPTDASKTPVADIIRDVGSLLSCEWASRSGGNVGLVCDSIAFTAPLLWDDITGEDITGDKVLRDAGMWAACYRVGVTPRIRLACGALTIVVDPLADAIGKFSNKGADRGKMEPPDPDKTDSDDDDSGPPPTGTTTPGDDDGGEPKLTPAEAYRRALRAWIADPSPANAAARQEAAERYKAALCRQGQKAYC